MKRLLTSRRLPKVMGVVAVLFVTAVATAQFGGGGGRGNDDQGNPFIGMPDRPGGFTFCRLYYNTVREDRSGSGWRIEYPDAEYNFMTRLGQFTTTRISRWQNGSPGSTVIRATDPELFQCPFVMLSSPGTIGLTQADVDALRQYLLKGGFIWGDDFWGEASWAHWNTQLRRILPEYESVDIPVSHQLFSTFYQIAEVPQIPSLNRWRPGASTSELGMESAVPHMRGVFDESGRLLVLSTHNTDIADGWEREDDLEAFFEMFSAKSYAVGINVAVWMMTH